MGVRTIGFQFTGDYRDLDQALDRMDARIRQSVTSANQASGAAGNAATRTSAAVRAGSDAAVRAGALVVEAEKRSTNAVQAHTRATEVAARAEQAAAEARRRAATALATADGSTGTGAAQVAAREVAIAEAAAAKRAEAELSVAKAAEVAAAREVTAAQAAAGREVAAQESAVRKMAGIEAAAYREREQRTKAAEAADQGRRDRRAAAAADVGRGLLLVGAGTAAGIGVAVKAFADFDSAMSRVQAGTNTTGADLLKLRQAAITFGAGTQFSATEAADAITALGKAGISTTDILGGGLKGSLDLAAAGQIDVAQAAEIGATALTQFRLKGSDLGHVADLLAAGAGKAQGEVTDLATALKYVGPVAKGLNVSIEETTGVLGEFAAQGIIGEQAGTSFRGLLLSLTSPSKQAAAEMKTLGINLYDARGKFVGMQGVAGQLQQSLGGMSDSARDAALGVLFGNEQVTAARVLYSGGAAAVADWTKKVDDSGFAARQAAALTDNLSGDLERLKGAFSTVFIQGGSNADGPLRSLTQSATSAVEAFSGLPESVQSTTFAFGALLAAAALTGGGLLVLLPKIAATKVALIELTGSATAARTALVQVGTGFAVVAAASAADALGDYIGKSSVATVETQKLAGALREFGDTGKLSGDGLKAFGAGIGPLNTEMHSAEQALDKFGVSAYNALDQGWDARGARIQSFGSVTGEFKQRVGELDTALADLVAHGDADAASTAFQRLTQAAVKQGVPLAVISKQFPQYAAAVAAAGKATSETSGKTGQLAGSMSDATTKAEKLATAIRDAADAASKATGKAFDSATDVLGSYNPAQGDAKATQAADALTHARQRLADVEERIASGRKGATVSEEQSLRRAREAVQVAEKAAKTAGGVSLAGTYRDTIQQATQFTKDISTALSKGLDPRYVQELLEQGPKQAGPILREIVSDHSGKLIDIVNTSEKKLRQLNQLAVEEARLTATAVASGTDQLTGDLSDAVRIATEKAKAGASATSEAIAKRLRLPSGTVERIAAEFGITLMDATQAQVNRGQILVSGKGTIRVETDGVAPAMDRLAAVKKRLDSIPKSKTVTVHVNTEQAVYGSGGHYEGGTFVPDRKADGGLIRGPGGPTDDRVHTLLSNREFVQPVRSVDFYGVDFMEAIRTMRLPRFADGGMVGSTSSLPPAASAGSAAAAVAPRQRIVLNQNPIVIRVPVHESHSESHTRTAHVEHLHLTATNPREFEDWAHDQARRAERSYS